MRSIATVVAFAATLALGSVQTAEAQIQAVPYGGYEGDGNGLAMVFAGASLQAESSTWAPFVNPFGYWLSQDIEGTDEELSYWAFAPTVGVNRLWESGLVGAGIGYLWLGEDALEAGGAGTSYSGGEEGVITNAQAEYWGDGLWHAQALGTVNWADDFVWARGRLSRQIAELGDHGLRIGGELVGQGNADYTAYQVGPYVELRTDMGLRVLVGGGPKWYDEQEDTAYWRVGLTWVPTG